MAKTALIVGGTGLVGGLLLRQLLQDSDYAGVIAIARRGVGFGDGKLTLALADASTLAAQAGQWRAETAFCCLGTTLAKAGGQAPFRAVHHDYIVDVARLAKANGATTFVIVSSLGADAGSTNFYLRVKGETERDVDALGFERLHILRPSLILGERADRRPAEALAQAAAPFLNAALIGPLRKYRAVRAEQVARAAAAFAKDPAPGVHIHESDELAGY